LEFRNEAKNRLASRGKEARRGLGRGTEKAIVASGKPSENEYVQIWRWRDSDGVDIPDKFRDPLRPARERPMVSLSLPLQTSADLQAKRAWMAAVKGFGHGREKGILLGILGQHLPPSERLQRQPVAAI